MNTVSLNLTTRELAVNPEVLALVFTALHTVMTDKVYKLSTAAIESARTLLSEEKKSLVHTFSKTPSGQDEVNAVNYLIAYAAKRFSILTQTLTDCASNIDAANKLSANIVAKVVATHQPAEFIQEISSKLDMKLAAVDLADIDLTPQAATDAWDSHVNAAFEFARAVAETTTTPAPTTRTRSIIKRSLDVSQLAQAEAVGTQAKEGLLKIIDELHQDYLSLNPFREAANTNEPANTDKGPAAPAA